MQPITKSTGELAIAAIERHANEIDWSSPETAMPDVLRIVGEVNGICSCQPVRRPEWGSREIVLHKALGAWAGEIIDANEWIGD